MNQPVNQLRHFDRVDATPLWSQIEARHAGPEIPPPPNHVRRAVIIVSALALFAGAVTFAWSAFHPSNEPATVGASDTSILTATLQAPADGTIPGLTLAYGTESHDYFAEGGKWPGVNGFDLPGFRFPVSVIPRTVLQVQGDASQVDGKLEVLDTDYRSTGKVLPLDLVAGSGTLPDEAGFYRLDLTGTWPQGTAEFFVVIQIQPSPPSQEGSRETLENPMDIPIALSYPSDWVARSVSQTTDGLSYGAAVSNVAAAVPSEDPGPMPGDPVLPQDYVRVTIFKSDRRVEPQDSQLPLSMDDAGVIPGDGNMKVLDAQVGGVPITIQVSAGPDASPPDLSAADAIVASIRPSTGSGSSETPSPSSDGAQPLKLRGLPFAVCRAESMKGSFGQGIDTAWLFEAEGKPGCTDPEESQHVAVGTPDSVIGMGGRLVDYFSEDASNVSLVATTDIDGDGIDEIAIMSRGGQSPTQDAWMLGYGGTYVTQLYEPDSGIVGTLSYTGGPAPGTSDRLEGGAVGVYAQDGTEVVHANFRAGEGFAVALDPGTYRVVPTSGDAQCAEQTVDVVAHAHRFVGLRIECSVK